MRLFGWISYTVEWHLTILIQFRLLFLLFWRLHATLLSNWFWQFTKVGVQIMMTVFRIFRRRRSRRSQNIILLLQLSVAAVCLLGLTCSISEEDEAVRIEEEECQCDDVLRPMFWHEFLPSYLACQADLVCLLTRMRWMTAKGEINASGAISTFKKANPSWYARKF